MTAAEVKTQLDSFPVLSRAHLSPSYYLKPGPQGFAVVLVRKGRLAGRATAMSAPGNIKAESKVEDVNVHDEGMSKRDEATIGVAEEHSLSISQVFRYNKRIVWWCFFFSMSAIGW